MTEPDVGLDPLLAGGVADVVEDRGPVGNGPVAGPGPEGIAQGVHVGVRPDAGVTEEVPGSTDRLTALEEDEAAVGTRGLEVPGRADP